MANTKLFSATDFEIFLKHYRGDYTMADAAEAVGFHPQTVYRALRDCPEWQAEVIQAREVKNHRRGEKSVKVIEEVRDDPNHKDRLRAAIKLAEVYDDDFRRASTQQLEISGRDGAPVQVEDRSASLAEVAKILETVGALRGITLASPALEQGDAADS